MPACSEITEDQDDAKDPAVGMPDGRGAVIDRAFCAILCDENGVVGETDHNTSSKNLFYGVLDLLAALLVRDMENFPQGYAGRIRLGPSCQPFGFGIDERHETARIRNDHTITYASESRAEHFPLLHETFAGCQKV